MTTVCATPQARGFVRRSRRPVSSTARVTARYIAPVSSTGSPSASATARATVDFPEPDAPVDRDDPSDRGAFVHVASRAVHGLVSAARSAANSG